MNRVELTHSQQAWHDEVGEARYQESRNKGIPVNQGYWNKQKKNRLENDKHAAAGELAVAIFLGIEWGAGVNTFKNPDVGKYQVRCTTNSKGSLIIRPEDPVDEIYILAVGKSPIFHIVGWQNGSFRMGYYLRSPNGKPPAWFIPQSELKDMNLLSELAK